MRVLLLQLDGKIPNIALMRLAAHHRDRGDEVELRRVQNPSGVERGFWDRHDRVYASLVFEKTRPVAERLLCVRPDAVVGGTGWDRRVTLEQHGVATLRQDYTDYPKWSQSIGFTQRGCRLKCEFCVVPEKEGDVREENSIDALWRGEPWPKQLILLDNDFFGSGLWREKIRAIRDGGFAVSFNQGINARMINDEAAEAIASVDYRDDGMKYKQLYTAWDSRKDERTLFRGLNALVKHGVRPKYIMVYMLIGFWADETEDDWVYRQRRLREFGCTPYPMPYVRNHVTRGFQRWCQMNLDKLVPWDEWKAANCQPTKLQRGERASLALLDWTDETP